MDFSKVKAITIPEGNVIKLEWNGFILWQLILSKLPKEYQELAYLSADKNAGSYFDLGFAFDTACKVEMLQYVTSEEKSTTSYPFGAAENSGVLRCMLSSPYDGLAVLYGSSGTSYGNSPVGYNTSGTINEFRAIMEKGYRELLNLTTGKTSGIQTGQGTYTMTNNLYLFAQNYNGSVRYGGMRKLGYFKYYDKNNELTHDLIPCYRKIDNKIGMYNVAKKQFFKNIGDGEFTAGHVDRYVNLLSWATDTDGTIYNGIGYKDTTRLSSSGGGNATSAASKAMCTSGFIPAKVGDVVRIKGTTPISGIASYLMTYDYNKTFIKHNQFVQENGSGYNYWRPVDVNWFTFENDTLTIPLTEANFGTGITYFRFSGHIDENTVVTVNNEIPNICTNMIPYAINLDETIYNDIGYKENTYLSDGLPVAKNGIDCTGFIPVGCGSSSSASGEQVIRLSNTSCDKTTNTRIALYNSSKTCFQTLYGTHLDSNGYDIAIPHEVDANGNLTYVDLTAISAHIRDVASKGALAYIRICSPNIDSNSIITVNQPILNTYTNLAEPRPNNIADTSKWVNGYRISSSGITAQEGTTLSNPITCKSGDIIRIKGVNLRENTDRLSVYIFRQDIQEYGWSHGYYNVGIDLGGNIVTELLSHKDGVYTFKLLYNTPHIISKLRFAMPTPIDASDVIITVNQEITNEPQPEEEVFNNWIPYSTESDDITIYNNGLGYKDGYRVRSGGEEAENEYGSITGYIPLKVGDTLRIYPHFVSLNTQNTINFYDESFAVIGQITNSGSVYGSCTANYQPLTTDEFSVLTLDSTKHDSSIAYVRITNAIRKSEALMDSGAEMKVTVNEFKSGNLFDQNDPNIVLGARINSSGSAVAYQDGQLVTGWIEAKNGDAFTISSDKSQLTNNYTGMIALYKLDKTYIGQFTNVATATGGWTWASDNLSGTVTIPNSYANGWSCEGCVYVRFCIPYTDINSIVITKR